MPTFNTTIEVDVIVHYDDVPACKGSRDSYGVPQEPDEPAHIEINKCISVIGNCGIVPSVAQQRDIIEQIAEHLDDADNFSRSEHADAMREARRDTQ